jgi:hypothetical protein
LSIHEQKEKPKNNGMKILDSQVVIIKLDGISIYGVVCSICFANLNIHDQKEKPKTME